MDDDTEVFYSCSATLIGELFVIGGSSQRKQVNTFFSQAVPLWYYQVQKIIEKIKVSKVIGCGLKRIGDLSYDFYFGACGTFFFPEERIFFCFSEEYKNKCER